MEKQPTQLDQDVVNLAKAIRHVESGGNFKAAGKSGEYGAYQFTRPTWEGTAKKYGVNVPLEQATPEQQNEVAYKQLKEWKDKGHNVGEIASMWNAGTGRPKAYLEQHVGTNKYGVTYNTPEYAKKVATQYHAIKGTSQSDSTQSSDQNGYMTTAAPVPMKASPELSSDGSPKEESLGEELGGRVDDASKAISSIAGGKEKTGQSRVSGIIQLGGAVAGGIGDVVGKALGLIPGVKHIEKIIGSGVQKLAETESGQAMVKSLQEFSQKHPELSKDLEAGFNIITAIPILKGLGTVKNIALDGISSTLKKKAESIAIKDLTSTAERTIGGRNAVKSTPKGIKTLIDERAIPDIENGKYNTQEAFEKLSQNISQIEEGQLQPALARASTQSASQRVPIEQLRKEALDEIKSEFKATGQVSKAEAEVNRVMDDYRNSYGDYVTLQDINEMKRGIRQSVNFSSPKLESDVTYHLGQVFMKNIESSAKKLGLEDIHAINQNMADLIRAQNMLKHIEGKPIKLGAMSGFIKTGATLGGEALGNTTGIPYAGALVGRGAGAKLGKKLTGGVEGILKRTGKDAQRVTKQEIKKKIPGLLLSTVNQKSRQDH